MDKQIKKNELRINDVIVYNSHAGAYGIVEHIGKKQITITKAIQKNEGLCCTSKIYFEPKNDELITITDFFK